MAIGQRVHIANYMSILVTSLVKFLVYFFHKYSFVVNFTVLLRNSNACGFILQTLRMENNIESVETIKLAN